MDKKKEDLLYMFIGIGALTYFLYVQINSVFIPIIYEGKRTIDYIIPAFLSTLGIILLLMFIFWFGKRYLEEK